MLLQPIDVCYSTNGRKGKKTRNVTGVLCPTVLAQSLWQVSPIFMDLGDIEVDWNAPQSAGYKALKELNVLQT